MPKVKRVRKVATIDHETLRTEHGSAEASSPAEEHASKVKQLIDDFRQVCASAALIGGGDAQGMETYMRNQFKFFGLKSPLRIQLQLSFVRSHTDELQDNALLLALCSALWNESERELQYFSVDLLRQYRQDLLGGGTPAEFWAVMRCIESLISTKSWWDTVDGLAYPVAGYMVDHCPALGVPLMQQWIVHDNMWLRRAAILHQVCQKKKTDEARLFSFCLARAEEREFFICKAIGWALRDYSKCNPLAVKNFVEKNRTSLSSLSIKEALRKIG
ncbi:hypothetical protein EMCRGX_G014223 [Ephydatia muelleri]